MVHAASTLARTRLPRQRWSCFAVFLFASHAHAQVILGSAGNSCPASNPAKLTSEAMCRAGMHALGHNTDSDYNGRENDASWPSACYYCRSVSGCQNGAWFNAHSMGSANGGAQPYCASVGYMPPAAGLVLLVGDSDIDYWPVSLEISGSYNVGVGGATCADVLVEIDALLSEFSPATVLLVCGENNLGDQSASQAFQDFSAIIGRITSTGARTLYIGTKPEQAPPRCTACTGSMMPSSWRTRRCSPARQPQVLCRRSWWSTRTTASRTLATRSLSTRPIGCTSARRDTATGPRGHRRRSVTRRRVCTGEAARA
jgi:hypothetical protein